ncbi:hypothetical protein J008_01279 [Cryptococcus neoformans]|nr:hypothetical protein C362_00804 [Cryptococcus neoformans var. grubii Bt1]OWZ67215.1 hypothetical protein AYX15_01683 [Cryptococcus neoformans var. grubii]OWZ79893.1 hypothetical protein C365_01475 [Cryptococcus neoformans var. grubii Bt85]OXG21595.1 hypothetical protein C366_01276 [Cryptococcus neoformans var. grubii Tu401-1]OXG31608.1 hypothetical protein C367_01291 [Cryptococcus neoformans var. grubii Ze90-1]OXM80912.1 hypothetical protein C364_01282 [Cryptococcus neoformans var. grubii B
MGKRKAAKKPVAKKKAEPLSSVFKCLFCNHDKAVNVKLDKATMFGHLHCKVCGQKYSTPINNLSAAVDVYCDWVDACEEVRQQQPPKQRAPRGPDPLTHGQAGGAAYDPEGEEDEEQEYNFNDNDEEEDDRRKESEDRGGKRRKVQEVSEDEDD